MIKEHSGPEPLSALEKQARAEERMTSNERDRAKALYVKSMTRAEEGALAAEELNSYGSRAYRERRIIRARERLDLAQRHASEIFEAVLVGEIDP